MTKFRNGTIVNGDFNPTPNSFNPATGMKAHTPPIGGGR